MQNDTSRPLHAYADLRQAYAAPELSPETAGQLALELFVAGYDGQTLPPAYADWLAHGLAGVILFKRNLVLGENGEIDIAALTAQTACIHQAAARNRHPWPAICSVDQEGGLVQRLRSPFSKFPPMRILGTHGDRTLIRRVGEQLGRECLAAGFNVDYAPILDVDTNPANPIIGNRAFSRDPEQVAEFAGDLLNGLQSQGVLGCGKHFPGHGDTDSDSHLELPVLPHDLSRMTSVELAPFAELAAHMQLVMTAHVLFPALDPVWPATLSPAILEPLLRTHCGFAGVIVSDDLEMQAVAARYDVKACVRRGLLAGCNLFLVCRSQTQLQLAVEEATAILMDLKEDSLRLQTLDSIARVRSLRNQLSLPQPSASAVLAVLGDAKTAELRRELESLVAMEAGPQRDGTERGR